MVALSLRPECKDDASTPAQSSANKQNQLKNSDNSHISCT